MKFELILLAACLFIAVKGSAVDNSNSVRIGDSPSVEIADESEKVSHNAEDLSDSQDQQNIVSNKLSAGIAPNQISTYADSVTGTLVETLDIKSLNQNREWTVIQRRQDGSVDFYRNWDEYKRGFGNPKGEFFIGLEKLHALTTYGSPQELLITLGDFEGQTRYAKYDNFVIGSEAEKYAIKVLGSYSGDAGDSLSRHRGDKFSTKDQQNDINGASCALAFKSGWWFDNCANCNLNGIYSSSPRYDGVNWFHWHGSYYSLKFTEMMIRSKK